MTVVVNVLLSLQYALSISFCRRVCDVLVQQLALAWRWWSLLNWIKPNSNFLIIFWIEFSGKIGYWIIFWIEFWNNPLNWILSWNEWMNHILNQNLPFLMKSPLFWLFWTLLGQFLGTFPIRSVLLISWPLNWIIFWIESEDFFGLENILE